MSKNSQSFGRTRCVNLRQDDACLHDGVEMDIGKDSKRQVYVVVSTVNVIEFQIGSVHEKPQVEQMIRDGLTVAISGGGKKK